MLGKSDNVFSDEKYMSAWAVVHKNKNKCILLRDRVGLDGGYVYCVYSTRKEARLNKGPLETVVRIILKKGCGR